MACANPECVDWCAGRACTDLAIALFECSEPGRANYDAAHPEPKLRELPPDANATPDPDDPDYAYDRIDPESEEELYQWEIQRREAIASHWRSECLDPCRSGLTVSELEPEGSRDEVDRFCQTLDERVVAWKQLRRPDPASPGSPPEVSPFMIIGTMGADSFAMSGSAFFGGSSLTVDMKSVDGVKHALPLRRMLRPRDGLTGAAACVGGALPEDGAKFAFELHFGPDGYLEEVRPETENDDAECIADILVNNVQLPPRAAQGLPPVRVEVKVRNDPDYGDMFGGANGDAFEGLTGEGFYGGDSWGQDRSAGAGGGGTGEGTIGGLGGLGSKGGGTGSGYGSGSGKGSGKGYGGRAGSAKPGGTKGSSGGTKGPSGGESSHESTPP